MKLNEKEKLICIQSVINYIEGEKYEFRFDPPDAIYIYISVNNPNSFLSGKIGNKFNTNQHKSWLQYYGDFFVTLSEYRRLKLEKLNTIK